jgi:hypothetical protein
VTVHEQWHGNAPPRLARDFYAANDEVPAASQNCCQKKEVINGHTLPLGLPSPCCESAVRSRRPRPNVVILGELQLVFIDRVDRKNVVIRLVALRPAGTTIAVGPKVGPALDSERPFRGQDANDAKGQYSLPISKAGWLSSVSWRTLSS